MDGNFDLLGDPIPEGWGRRGRPQHIASEQNRNKVMMLLAFGWNNERIARALGITPPTLRKNYFRELRFRDEARDRMDANLAMRLWTDSMAGNVGATKEFIKLVERNDLMIYGQKQGGEKPQGSPQKLGKKAQERVDALHPNTGSKLGEMMARRQQGSDPRPN